MPKPTIFHSLDLFRGGATIGAVDMRSALTVDYPLAIDEETNLSLYPHHYWPDVVLLWRQMNQLAHFLDHIEHYCEELIRLRAHCLESYPSPSRGDLHGIEEILRARERRQSFYTPGIKHY